MLIRITALVIAIAACTCPAAANDDPEPKPPDQEALDLVTERGLELVDYDAATAAATDAIAKINVNSKLVEHIIAHEEEDKWIVSFGKLNAKKDAFVVAYEAVEGDEPGDFRLKTIDPPRSEKGFPLAAAKGIALVLKDHEGPERPYNILLGRDPDDQIRVYLTPAPTDPKEWVLGEDVRYLVAADGAKIVEKRILHDKLIEKPALTESKIKSDTVSRHETTIADIPEDTDVYHVLTREHSVPEIIVTPHFEFKIDLDGAIALIPKKDSKPAEKSEKSEKKPTDPG